MKKYELVDYNEITRLHRVKALKDFGSVKVGDIGGWIEKEENLSHSGNAWVYGNAQVYGNAKVSGNAWVSGKASVYGNAWVSGDAQVTGNAKVTGNAWVYGNAKVFGDASVSGNASVSGDAQVYGNAKVSGDAQVGKTSDYHIFKNNTTSTRYFTYTKSNDSWKIGCFYGTTEELEKHLKENGSELQKLEYGLYIELVKKLNKN